MRNDEKRSCTTDRKPLNTTINGDVLDEFKRFAKESNIPMNVLLEVFMQQLTSGGFRLAFTDSGKMKLNIDKD